MPSIFDLFNDDFFKGMIDFDGQFGSIPGNITCDKCGMSYSEFNRTGKFGCGHCYEAFGDRVPALINRIQGSVDYKGAIPNRTNGVFKIKHQIKQLRQELQAAVAKENFERAMVLRDQIKSLEESLIKK